MRRGITAMHAAHKIDPLWQAPDWHFVEAGVPIPPENDPSRFMPGVMGNTAIYLGDGIAIPHGKSDSVIHLAAALGIHKRGVDFEALDGEPAAAAAR